VSAASVEVEGLRLPAPLGGHPALDFCNTWVGWNEPAGHDYLKSFDHLAVWAGHAGLFEADRVAIVRRHADRDRPAAAAALTRARRLRAGLYGVLLHGPERPGFAALAAEARAAAGGRIEQHVSTREGLDAPTLAVAWAATQLLTGAHAPVRACPGHDCGWLFLDPTGRRRWCTMATCGNRAKVARFARRQRRSEG
jgi:predicted RNA-binding Zn ribbon-like protein